MRLLSRFLPQDFREDARVVLLAGQGRYPELLLERFRRHDLDYHLVAFENEASANCWDSTPLERRTRVNVGKIGHWLKILEKNAACYVLLAGQVSPGKLFGGLSPDFKALCLLGKLKRRNAETIFGAVVAEIEKLGIEVLDARSFLDDQLADIGLMTQRNEGPSECDLIYGVTVARGVADLDVGQSVLVYNGTTVAVEAFEGTDAAIERADRLCPKPMGLVKTGKKNQDFRFDVPVFGLRTLDLICHSHVRWVALESQKTLILEKEMVVERADDCGVALVGF
jgi:DUF1009 family protein